MPKPIRLVRYWGPRLPWKFTVPFLALMLGWLVLVGYVVPTKVFFEGVVALGVLALGVLLPYNLAAWLNRKWRKSPTVEAHDPEPKAPGTCTVIKEFMDRRRLEDLRIGIVLAGGGAKGAYQAGAMKAIYEFLEANNALDKVRMIASTSIGSWNAMFWLAGLVKPPKPGEPSAHERWWRAISVDRIMEFDTYWPLRTNHFLKSTPWQEAFDALFVKPPAIKAALEGLFYGPGTGTGDGTKPINFYFTRSSVKHARLEFATNQSVIGLQGIVPRGQYELIEKKDGVNPLERMKLAIFASMDLPPLFPYMTIPNEDEGEEIFEDGGVVDNLPIRFGEFENCHLLFVLPLNASFEEKARQDSVIRRLFRVMDVRQGVLERNSLQMTQLYNKRMELNRKLLERQPGTGLGVGGGAPPARGADLPGHFINKIGTIRPDPVSIFAICPRQPLKISTTEFWKTVEAGEAFDLMYSATKSELDEHFREATDPNRIHITLVGPCGERTREVPEAPQIGADWEVPEDEDLQIAADA
jgi:predicted acylesterase/phospholipase RssA